jgi:hypothetical protein
VVIRGGDVVASAALRAGCAELERIVTEHLAERGIHADRHAVRELIDELRFDSRPHGEGTSRVQCRRGGVADVDLGLIGGSTEAWLQGVVSLPRQLFQSVSDDVGAELVESGVFVTGGGTMLPGLVAAIAAGTGLATLSPENRSG